MLWLLNKSAIWLLCQCVNHWLWNSSKLPFTGAVLQSTSPSNPPVRPPGWSAQGTRAVGPVVSISPRYSGTQIHSLGWRTFQAVGSANCVIYVSIPRSLRLGRLLNYNKSYFLSASGNLLRVVLFVNNHKNWNDSELRFVFLKNLLQIRKWKPSQHYRLDSLWHDGPSGIWALLDSLPTNQLAVSQITDYKAHGQDNLQTSKLAKMFDRKVGVNSCSAFDFFFNSLSPSLLVCKSSSPSFF